jgi:hypothetical protein
MITNNGKQLIGKFLLGQAPNFATHIAAGCGPTALLPDQELSIEEVNSIKEKSNLDFEVFRVPISAKGFIKEDGVEKIVFKAEMPTEQRYQITEVAFFPAAENSIAGAFDSKTLATFVPTENWVAYSNQSASTVAFVSDDNLLSNSNGDIIIEDLAYYVSSNANLFNEQDRKQRQEAPRFYNRALVVSGSSSYIDENFEVIGEKISIENSTLAFNFNQNLPPDEVKIAFSLLATETSNNVNPDKVRVILDFLNNIPGLELSSPKARAIIELSSEDFEIEEGESNPASINRYKIITRKLSQFALDDTFSWANINLIRIYASVIEDVYVPIVSREIIDNVATVGLADEYYMFDGQRFNIENVSSDFNGDNFIFTSASATSASVSYPVSASASPLSNASAGSLVYKGRTNNYKILFDGLRLDNVSSQNPLYTMVGYDIIRNDNAYPILKAENTNNYIEYRFGIGVT